MAGANHLPIFDQMAALGDGFRCRMLSLLEGHELTVSEFCDVLQLPQSTVSRHLKVLADGGWVASRHDGTRRPYRLARDRWPEPARRLWQLTREQTIATPAAVEDARRLRGVLAERATRSRAFFAGAAGRWDRLRDDLFGRRFYLLGLLGLLPADLTIADLGCGTGRVAEAVAPFARRVLAVDESDAMLGAAGDRLDGTENVELLRGAVESLPIDDAAVDAATLILVLHHLPDPARALEEAARILRPGGRALVVEMLPHEHHEYREEMGHVWMGFAIQAMTAMLENAGFSDVRAGPLPAEPEARGPALFAASATRG